jgi:phytoene dehydrogenase-like protein
MSTPEPFDVIVIGAGPNGLVAAAALGKAGRRVLCLERSDTIGGQSRLLDVAPGFRAPLTAEADWLPPSVTRALEMTDLDLVPPQIAVSVPMPDGGFLSLASDPTRAAESIRSHSRRDADHWGAFTLTLHKLAGFLGALYQLPPPDVDSTSLRDIPSLLSLARKFRSLGKANMNELLRVLPIPVQDLLDDWFEYGPLKAAVGAGAVRDIRQGPRSGGTSFVLLHYLAGAGEGSVRGRPWSRSGPDAFVTMAEQAARKHGVVIRTGAEVAQIVVRDDAVAGVRLRQNDEGIPARAVVSTADPARTFLHTVDPVWLDPEFLLAVRNIKFRGSTAVVLYALDRVPNVPGLSDAAQALAGVVSLTGNLDSLEKAYDAAKYGSISEQPHVEISVPTLRWPQLAPAGKHVLVAKVQYAPYALRSGATWDAATSSALGEAVTRQISRVSPGFASAVLYRVVLTPRDIEARFGLTEGAATHGELTLDQILFMRPVAGWGQYAMPVSGLYLGGAGAHPGPGVLGAPGLLAAQRLLTDWGKRR